MLKEKAELNPELDALLGHALQGNLNVLQNGIILPAGFAYEAWCMECLSISVLRIDAVLKLYDKM